VTGTIGDAHSVSTCSKVDVAAALAQDAAATAALSARYRVRNRATRWRSPCAITPGRRWTSPMDSRVISQSSAWLPVCRPRSICPAFHYRPPPRTCWRAASLHRQLIAGGGRLRNSLHGSGRSPRGLHRGGAPNWRCSASIGTIIAGYGQSVFLDAQGRETGAETAVLQPFLRVCWSSSATSPSCLTGVLYNIEYLRPAVASGEARKAQMNLDVPCSAGLHAMTRGVLSVLLGTTHLAVMATLQFDHTISTSLSRWPGADASRFVRDDRRGVFGATMQVRAGEPGAGQLTFKIGFLCDFRQLLSGAAPATTVTVSAILSFPDEARQRYPRLWSFTPLQAISRITRAVCGRVAQGGFRDIDLR